MWIEACIFSRRVVCATSGASRSWKAVQPAFKLLWDRLYHHDAQLAAARAVEARGQAAGAAGTTPNGAGGKRTFASLAAAKSVKEAQAAAAKLPTQEMELPYMTKYILLAAYLASFNPPNTDVKFFTRDGSGKRRRRRTTKRMTVRTMGGVWHCVLLTLMVPTGCFAQDTKRQQLIGPKFFPLERLLAITFSLLAIHDCEESAREANTADLYSEVHTLPQLSLPVSFTAELFVPGDVLGVHGAASTLRRLHGPLGAQVPV